MPYVGSIRTALLCHNVFVFFFPRVLQARVSGSAIFERCGGKQNDGRSS